MRIFAFDLKRQRNGLVITGLMTQETQKSMLSRQKRKVNGPEAQTGHKVREVEKATRRIAQKFEER